MRTLDYHRPASVDETCALPPVLPTLLAKGEIDAMLNLPPFVPRAIASGDYRLLAVTGQEWEKMVGTRLPFAFFVASRKVVEGKRAALRKLVDAWREGAEHIRKTPDVLNSFLVEAKITDPAAQKIARDFMVPLYMTGLTDKDVENVPCTGTAR